MRTGEIVDNKMDAETEKAQAAFGAASGSAARQPRPLRRRVWHVAAYGTMHREETKFYAVKSADDCIASEIATEDVATLLARSPKMLDALLDIYAVATGERQVADDDTEGMAWIAKRIARLDLPPNADVSDRR